MKPLVITLFKNDNSLVNAICDSLGFELGVFKLHQFPDGESYFRIKNEVADREIIFFDSLYNPNDKILPIIFAAKTILELGARRIGLITPYLSYMRQDIRFKDGEAITSKYFAKLISDCFDYLITVDPHLHRYKSLDEIYSIPSSVLHAAPIISNWIKNNVDNPILIGPDIESEQWVSNVADKANAPFLILEKIRRGDRDVEISNPDIEKYKNNTPVLVDDIISTARTMIETIKHILKAKMKKPICIGVHPVFADTAYEELLKSGVEKIISCNSISHKSNQIDLSSLIIDEIKKFF